MNTANGTITVRSSDSITAILDRFARFYLCVSDGTWIKVAKADVHQYLSKVHRHVQQYVVTEENERKVGAVAYIQPIRKFEWTHEPQAEPYAIHDAPTDNGQYVIYVGRKEPGVPLFLCRVRSPDGRVFLVSHSDTIGEAKEAAMIDYADRKRGVK